VKIRHGMRARWKTLAATALSVVFVVGVGEQSAHAYQIDMHLQSGYRWTIDVESNFTFDEVKLRVQDRMGIFPPDMCLVYRNKFLVPSRQLSDYNIQAGSVIEVFDFPVVSRWSITPDEPSFGGTVSNLVETVPVGKHFEVVAGSLPAGIALDTDTGVLTGAFTELGDFSATIRATTECGDSDLIWTGTVAKLEAQTDNPDTVAAALPDTGTNAKVVALIVLSAAISSLAGVLILLRRRREWL